MSSASNIPSAFYFYSVSQQVGLRGEYFGLFGQNQKRAGIEEQIPRVCNGGWNYRRRDRDCRRSGDCRHGPDRDQFHDYRIHRNQPNHCHVHSDVGAGWFACRCGLHRLACGWPNQVGTARALWPVCLGTETPAFYSFFYSFSNFIVVQKT